MTRALGVTLQNKHEKGLKKQETAKRLWREEKPAEERESREKKHTAEKKVERYNAKGQKDSKNQGRRAKEEI